MVFDKIKQEHICIEGRGLTFRFTLTDRESIEKALGKIGVSKVVKKEDIPPPVDFSKLWSVTDVEVDGEGRARKATLVLRELNSIEDLTFGVIAQQFKKVIE